MASVFELVWADRKWRNSTKILGFAVFFSKVLIATPGCLLSKTAFLMLSSGSLGCTRFGYQKNIYLLRLRCSSGQKLL